eukprot:875136-Amphidinium_carterae.1
MAASGNAGFQSKSCRHEGIAERTSSRKHQCDGLRTATASIGGVRLHSQCAQSVCTLCVHALCVYSVCTLCVSVCVGVKCCPSTKVAEAPVVQPDQATVVESGVTSQESCNTRSTPSQPKEAAPTSTVSTASRAGKSRCFNDWHHPCTQTLTGAADQRFVACVFKHTA